MQWGEEMNSLWRGMKSWMAPWLTHLRMPSRVVFLSPLIRVESSTATLKTFLLERGVDSATASSALLAVGRDWLFMIASEGQTFVAALRLAYSNRARTGSMSTGSMT